jgi:hypothetical protein
MKTPLVKAKMLKSIRRTGLGLVGGFALLVTAHASAQATVTTLTDSNHGKPGYRDGNTFSDAQFRFPSGLALDPSEQTMFVADCSNNVVRKVTNLGDKANSYTYSAFVSTNGISRPVDIAVDGDTNIYVLNRGNGNNGTILEFNGAYYLNYGLKQLIATNAANLTNATAITLDNAGNLYAAVNNNTVIWITSGGSNVVVGVITNAGTSLRGITMRQDGKFALTDAGNNGIWLMDPANTNTANNSVKLTGFNGAGDVLGPPAFAAFNRPEKIAKAGNNYVVVADFNNHKIKVIDASGNVTRLFGVSSTYWSGTYQGWRDGTVNSTESLDPVQSRNPYALAVATDGTLYDAENYYHLLRVATGTGLPPLPPPPPPAPTILGVVTNINQVIINWTAISGAASYNVKRAPSSGGPYDTLASVTTNSYTDTAVSAGTTYYYVVSAVSSAGAESANSAEVSATVPVPPPPAPEIGWFEYVGTAPPVTLFHQVSGAAYIAHNDLNLAVQPNVTGVATYFTADGSTPSQTNGSTPPFYADGQPPGIIQALPVTISPDVVIKAVNVNTGGSSAVSTAEFLFQVANPIIVGNNAAQFGVSNITTGAQMYYTTDTTDPNPTNSSAIGPISSGTTLSLAFPAGSTNLTFKIRGYKSSYSPSDVVTISFAASNAVANTISFGFGNGEASSDFVAAPGQTFYAPVTLTTLPNTKMYSLQFNVTVTNNGVGPAITNTFGFQSMLMKPDPDNAGYYLAIPPQMFTGTTFTNLEFTNSSMGLLGVGWLERYTKTNLYNTMGQTLISYSLAHDDLFPNTEHPNDVIVGGYSLQIPGDATNGQQYQIQIGRPSATDDGIGAPGSSVYISAPTNGALAGGLPLNALKIVTVGQRKYIAGSVYPFRWFNAGDFGSSNIVNADVEQVFQSAVYALNYPPFDESSGSFATGFTHVSDFYDAMDSCGYTYVDNGNGYLEKDSAADTTVLFNGDDTTINQIAFGDGKLDVCDVYITYRRALDPSLNWFGRFWTNGERVAEIVPNVTAQTLQNPSVTAQLVPSIQPLASSISTAPPQVNFSAGDIQGSAGQTVQVPIYASIHGNYPLRVLMLNLTVTPLDGSPALAAVVQFTPNAALGAPYTTDSVGNGNYSAVWLNSSIAGLTGNSTVGTLTVTIPATASATAAYAVHFDHASASPNGLASFPEKTLTGLITLASRTNSSYGDGIPDSWRLRWFGTVNNYLSLSNACPTGDGINNWMKYVAGVDPNVANNFPATKSKSPVPGGYTAAIHWPTVEGKQYVILRSSNLFSDSWTAISTNTGTGADMEFDDNSSNAVKFYRVQILP